MQFELKRTSALFGCFNRREEKNKGRACDLPFEVTIGAQMLPSLIPAVDGDDSPDSFINELFSPEGYARRPALNPLTLHRKPEGAVVNIWDREDFGDPLRLNPCSLTGLKIELVTPHQIVLKGKIQYSQYNDDELVRIDALATKRFDLSIFIEQADLFADHKEQEEDENEEEQTDLEERDELETEQEE